MSITGVLQSSMRSSYEVGHIGTCYLSPAPTDYRTGINVMDLVYDTWTLTRSSANATYGPVTYVAPDGTSYSYTFTVAGSTTAGDSTTAAQNFAQKNEITSYYTVSVSSNVVTFTARNRGVLGASFDENDSNLSKSNSVVGTAGSNVPVGRVVFSTGIGTVAGERVPKLVLPSDRAYEGTAIAAQVVTLTYASNAANDVLFTRITVPALDEEIIVTTVRDTDAATTLTAHAAALNTELDARLGSGYGIVAAVVSSTITLTAEVPGYAFSVAAENSGTGTGTWTRAYTTGGIGNPATDAMCTLAGIVARGPGAVPSADGEDDAVYKPGTGVPYLRKATGLRVASTESWGEGDRLWVSVAAGATDGRLYGSGSSTRLPIPRSIMTAHGYDSATVGRVNLSL